MNLLSLVRLGIDIGSFPGISRSLVDELFITTQPAHLQKRFTEKLNPDARDVLRADMVRDRLIGVRRPVHPPVSGNPPGKPEAE
jgi:protein arginine kinase